MHTPQPGLADLRTPHRAPAQGATQVEIGRVVATHPETDSIDVELLQGGRLFYVPILRSDAGRTFGDAGLPTITPGTSATATGQHDVYALVAYLRGNALLPVALGFLGPKDTALLKRPSGSAIHRGPGGQTVVERDDGSYELRVAGGSLRLGANGGSGSLATLDASLAPSGAAAAITLANTGGASVTLTAAGGVTIAGALSVNGYALTVPAAGTIAYRDVANTFSAAQAFSAGVSFDVMPTFPSLTAGEVLYGGAANAPAHDSYLSWSAASKRLILGVGATLWVGRASGGSTTAGDIDAAGTVKTGTPIGVASGGTGVAALPTFLANKNGSAQSGVVSGVVTQVTMTNESYDNNGNYDAANSKFLPTVAGTYLFFAGLRFTAAADQTEIVIMLYKNGAEVFRNTVRSSGAGAHQGNVLALLRMNGTSDYVELYVYQNSGADKTIDGPVAYTSWGGAWITP